MALLYRKEDHVPHHPSLPQLLETHPTLSPHQLIQG